MMFLELLTLEDRNQLSQTLNDNYPIHEPRQAMVNQPCQYKA